jgi:UDP-N-acetylmuramyl pentapeptide phosphotransferase/UDP-N-acetylglucosamine-1-phosphate transferase
MCAGPCAASRRRPPPVSLHHQLAPGTAHLGSGDAIAAAAILAATAFLGGLATRALIPALRRRDVLDRPNERSSHTVPIPRGGGIALIGTVLLAWLALCAAGRVSPAIPIVALATVLLATVCWIDDLRGLSPATRLAAQAAAVALGLYVLPGGNAIEGFLGVPTYFAAAGLLWVWWINLFNFMDGIDGLAGSEAAAIGGGLLLSAILGIGVDPALALLAAAILGAALGFLASNWSPARIFLGDVGSAPLGYLTGFLLLGLAARGSWRVALILPLYFLADATITLLRRLARGERVWQAHRRHFYQQAVQKGLGHAAVVRRVIAADLLLIGCGWAAENGWGGLALGAAFAIVAVLLVVLAAGN